MKKKCCSVLIACAISVSMLGGCGKAAQEENPQEGVRAETEETSASGENSRAETDGAPAPGESSRAKTDGASALGENGQAEQDSGIMFEAQDLEGNTVTESVFTESGLTMVNVWATYCNPCLSEMPGLGEIAGEYDPVQFQVIGIVSDVQEGADEEMTEYASDLVSQTGADYPHLLLNESLYMSLLRDVSAVPTTFFVDENGEVLDTVVGAMDKSEWKEKIDAFLEK